MKNSLSLFYDEDCPFCCWYSQKFVDFHFISAENRKSYQREIYSYQTYIDLDRARNEIACYDSTTQSTTYGINSLLVVLATKWPFLIQIAKFPPIYFILKWLYSFISYNRKIIFPGKNQTIQCNCEPERSWFWRILFIVSLSALTAYFVTTYFDQYLKPYENEAPINDGLLLLFQLGFQLGVFKLLKQKDAYNYLGHLALTSFVGALGLVFVQFILNTIQNLLPGTSWLALPAYGAILFVMFHFHKIRLERNGWTNYLSISWIFFRILIYATVFKF